MAEFLRNCSMCEQLRRKEFPKESTFCVRDRYYYFLYTIVKQIIEQIADSGDFSIGQWEQVRGFLHMLRFTEDSVCGQQRGERDGRTKHGIQRIH